MVASTVVGVEALLESVMDPELSEISIRDLGILRGVHDEAGVMVVTVTPTYSGCPAMGQIADDIAEVLDGADVAYELRTVLDPVWTTDWMSDKAKRSLTKWGIAAPDSVGKVAAITCPQCGADDTEILSIFGSTACKAMNRCLRCLEPFESFKAI
jgi:ring-1,2-phenylacetyl-CoA epoxidase subunit PaaD